MKQPKKMTLIQKMLFLLRFPNDDPKKWAVVSGNNERFIAINKETKEQKIVEK